MQILPTINFHYQPTAIRYNTMSNPQAVNNKGLTCDKFQHSSPIASNVSFQSNVSEGYFLRSLSGVHDPYSGVVILNSKEMHRINQDISRTRSGREKVRYLSQHTESMLPVESVIYDILRQGIKKDRYATLGDILTKEKSFALMNLLDEENNVFMKIKEASSDLSDKNKAKVLKEVSKAERRILLPHDDKNHFRRSRFINTLVRISQHDVLNNIEERINKLPQSQKEEALERFHEAKTLLENNPYNTNIKGKSPIERVRELQAEFAPDTLDEPNELEPIINIASKLPTSKSSVNAFIIEMSDRSDKDIAMRLVSESLGTVEHVVPESKGGPDEAYNFIYATKSRNEERGNMPMKYFIRKYPDIPKYCQQYMNDVMKAGQSSQLRGHEWYPYVIRETLREEMGVRLDTSSYKVAPQKAFKSFPSRLQERYPQFNKYFTNPQ